MGCGSFTCVSARCECGAQMRSEHFSVGYIFIQPHGFSLYETLSESVLSWRQILAVLVNTKRNKIYNILVITRVLCILYLNNYFSDLLKCASGSLEVFFHIWRHLSAAPRVQIFNVKKLNVSLWTNIYFLLQECLAERRMWMKPQPSSEPAHSYFRPFPLFLEPPLVSTVCL